MLVKITARGECAIRDKHSFIVKKAICGAYNSYLRAKFSTFVSAKHGVKARATKMAKVTAGIIGKELMEINNKRYKIPIGMPYKVELADIKLETLLQAVPGILTELEVQAYYLLDLDITKDFAGIFNKEEMRKYTSSNC